VVGDNYGDEFVTEIDVIGRLSNTIVGDSSIPYASGLRSV
jgi:hypothetical protein